AERVGGRNDYLGLSNHPQVIASVAESVTRHGMGPRSSPLVAGHTEQQGLLSRELAELKGMEDAVIFSCGFAANTAVFSLFGQGEDVEVFSDELNHASIIDGLRLAGRSSKSKVSVYKHVDMEHLESLLQASSAARKIVVSDSLFSMDGDVAPMSQLLLLKQKYNFFLALDDAHASLVYSKQVIGFFHYFSDFAGADLIVGTMSKAFGAHGGFVCSSQEFVDLLVNMARPLIYSTALPDPVIAAARASLRLSEDRPWIRAKLWNNVRLFEQTTGVPARSPIVPILLGEEERALRASKELLLLGFHVPAIRPPTVKPGTARLRVALSAAHEEEEIVRLADAMRKIGVIE
ncbi:hypothetical protein GUITHDRAFT_80526, partial [Guillardia theta CCMP2712]